MVEHALEERGVVSSILTFGTVKDQKTNLRIKDFSKPLVSGQVLRVPKVGTERSEDSDLRHGQQDDPCPK